MDNGNGTVPGPAPGTVPLHRLTFVDEGHDVLIGRPEIESFALFPADGAELVRRLQAGDTVGEVADWYLAEYGEEADVDDVVAVLHSLGFVRTAEDGVDTPSPDEDPDDPDRRQPVRWQRLGAVLFSRAALAVYAVVAVAAIYLEVRKPVLRPAPGNFFAGRSLLLLTIVVYVAEALGALLHEAFHALAGRRLGLGSRLTLDRRLTFIVFQTTMTGLMGVKPRRRILPFLAGLLADAVNYSLMVVVAAVDAHLHGPLTIVGHFALLLAYLTLLRMCWQFMIFMETDLYYVFATVAHCPNLMRLTRQELRGRIRRALGRPPGDAPLLTPTPQERRILRFYLPFVAAGAGVVLGSTVVFAIPVLVQFLIRLTRGIADGSVFSARFWDSAGAAVAVGVQIAILLLLIVRDRRATRASRAARLAAASTSPQTGATA